MAAYRLKPYSIDLSMLRESLDHNEALIAELISDFLRDSKRLMAQVEKKFPKEKWKLLEDDLHQFKGLVSHFDNGELYALASKALALSRQVNLQKDAPAEPKPEPQSDALNELKQLLPSLKSKLLEFSKALRQVAQGLQK